MQKLAPQAKDQMRRVYLRALGLSVLVCLGMLAGVLETMFVFEWEGLSLLSGQLANSRMAGYALIAGVTVWLTVAMAFVGLVYHGILQPGALASGAPESSVLRDERNESAIRQLAEEIERRTRLVERKARDVERLHGHVRRLDSQSGHLQAQRKQEEQRLASLRGKRGLLQLQVSESQARSANLEQKAQRLREAVSSLEHERELLRAVKADRERLADDRDSLGVQIGQSSQQMVSLQAEIDRAKLKITELCTRAAKERDRLEGFKHQANMSERARDEGRRRLESLQKEVSAWEARSARLAVTDPPRGWERELSTVISHRFQPPPSSNLPQEKLGSNVVASHHRVRNMRRVIAQLVGLSFVHRVGMSRRQRTKRGKVQLTGDIDQLEVLVPENTEADILRVTTTCETKPQRMLAAHLIAHHFGVPVQGP